MKEMFLIKREKDTNYYSELQNTSFLRIRDLSGKVWTDFNEHDPGITITDYLNYGLYDLHYRFTFPLESYLNTGKENSYKDKGLFSRHDLYVTPSSGIKKETVKKSIVTEEDYEELILNEYAYCINKCSVKLNRKTLKYDFIIKHKVLHADAAQLQKLEKEIAEFYHKNRNIGETLGRIYFHKNNSDDKKLYYHRRYTKDRSYIFPEFKNVPYEYPDQARPFVSDYQTIQYDFPENYGISNRGIPLKDDPSYKTKVLQLKAYLLIFDTLMAEQLQLTKMTHSLFELQKELPKRMLPQVTIVESEKIIDTEKKREAEQQISNHFYEVQKFRYLNVLDSIYGENTRTVFGKKNLSELNAKREALILNLPFLNENRFRSFDIYNQNSTAVIQQTFEQFFSAEGIDYRISKKNVRILPDEEFLERYRFLLSPYLNHIEDQTIVEEIPLGKAAYDEKHFYKVLRLHFNLIWNGVLFESLLKYGTDLSNYKILNYSNEYLLMFFHPEKKIGINMSLFFSDKNRLIELTYLFCDFIDKYRHSNKLRSFYLVEHILFDFISVEQASRVSIILSDQLPKERTEHILKTRLPVHLQITLHYLPDILLKEFHVIYANWRNALCESAHLPKHFMYIQSFLRHHKSLGKEI